MTRALCRSVLSAAMLLMSCLSASAISTSHKGINGGDLYNLSSTQLAAVISDYRAMGVKWVRFDFDWSVIQPDNPATYNVAAFDATVKALKAAGINVLGIIDYSPSWANGGAPSKFYPPVGTAGYANYASYLAHRYGPMGVHSWEIWNEPNLGQFWGPTPDPAAYTALLKAAYSAIHLADPQAIVITGGLAQPWDSQTSISALKFLSAIYANGGKSFFDAVADHPYLSPDMPNNADDNNWQKMYATTPSFLSIMKTYADSRKKIWITEVGAPTYGASGQTISESQQAEMLTQAYTDVSNYGWAGPLFWYNYQDYCPYSTGGSAECYFGVRRNDNSMKPSYGALAKAPS